MKKLMIVAAAAMGLAAFGDIESTNIVGYKNAASSVVGINMMSQAFDAVASESYSLADIKPYIDESLEEMYTGGIYIMTLTDGGETDKMYFWTLDGETPDGSEGAGWFDDQGVRCDNTVTFAPGEGFVVLTDYETSRLSTAGEVAQQDTVFKLITGINSCGNTTSASIKLADIEAGVGIDAEGNMLLLNEETGDEMYTGGIYIMTMTDSGETDKMYFFTLDGEAPDGSEGAGWFDDQGVRCDETVTFDAGVGFVILSDYEAGCIRIPSAL